MQAEKIQVRKKMGYILGGSIFTVFTFMVLLLMEALNWVQNEWDGVEFATVVFQLHTPLKGTSREVYLEFFKACLYPAVLITLFIMLFFIMVEKILKRFHNPVAFWMVLTGCFLAVFIYLGRMIYADARDIGVFQYMEEVNKRSTLFEENYIDPDSVLLEFPEEKRNLVLIYLESMETTYASTEDGGGKAVNYIPELTELAKNNINFSESAGLGGGYSNYGCGWTVGALLGTSTGVPFKSSIEGNAMEQYSQFLPGITSLGELLEREGYSNYFLCGSDAAFGGRDIFYKSHGNYQMHDSHYATEQGYISDDDLSGWGLDDKTLYEIARKELAELGNSGDLFNYTMLTIDTHHPSGYPCDLCGNQYEEQYANVIACASKQAAEFVSWIEAQPWYENTTVVLIGDHTSMVADFWDDIGEYQRRTYNCFLNVPEELRAADTKNKMFCTLDYFPTIVASLGVKIEGEKLGLGTNLFSDEVTLIEEMGKSGLDSKISNYSVFYIENFEKEK